MRSFSAKASGETAQVDDMLEIHYVGTLDNGDEFDNSRTRDSTLGFTVGR